eukprot:2887-Heterococcus_DN1.PRE.3
MASPNFAQQYICEPDYQDTDTSVTLDITRCTAHDAPHMNVCTTTCAATTAATTIQLAVVMIA